jgi:hypothetical protein
VELSLEWERSSSSIEVTKRLKVSVLDGPIYTNSRQAESLGAMKSPQAKSRGGVGAMKTGFRKAGSLVLTV